MTSSSAFSNLSHMGSSPCDPDRDLIVTEFKGGKLLSLPAQIIEAMRVEPKRNFMIPDVVEITGKTPTAVRQALCRLSGSGKGSGPIMRIDHGLYKYDPSKMENSLQALARSGDWKIENLVFVTKGARGGLMSQSQDPEIEQEQNECDIPSGAIPRAGYPHNLPTGQQVTWDVYPNGTQLIRLSAKGAPPFSPDLCLYLLQDLNEKGLDYDIWDCKSIEVNVDTQKFTVDACHTLQFIEGLLFKVYQHGYNTRFEIADRRKVPLREIMDFIHGLTEPIDGRITRKKVDVIEYRLNQIEKAMRITRRKPPTSSKSKEKVQDKGRTPKFITGAEMKAAQATEARVGESS